MGRRILFEKKLFGVGVEYIRPTPSGGERTENGLVNSSTVHPYRARVSTITGRNSEESLVDSISSSVFSLTQNWYDNPWS